MANELQNRGLFDGMMRNLLNDDFFRANRPVSYMKTDITENGKEYKVKVDMPGFEKKDIHISYDDDILTITGHRDTFDDDVDKDGNILHSERRYGQMSRQYRLPDVDLKAVSAKYAHGVLTVTLPKLTEKSSDSRHIEID